MNFAEFLGKGLTGLGLIKVCINHDYKFFTLAVILVPIAAAYVLFALLKKKDEGKISNGLSMLIAIVLFMIAREQGVAFGSGGILYIVCTLVILGLGIWEKSQKKED